MGDGSHICRRTGLFLVLAQLDTEGNILTKIKTICPVVLEGMRYQEMFTDIQTDGRTDRRRRGDPPQNSFGLCPEGLTMSLEHGM